MAITHIHKAFAVADAKISAVTADPTGGTTTYGTAIDVPGIKNVGLDFEINNVSLRGDNKEMDSDSTLVAVNITFAHAKVNFDALAVMIGGTVTDSGSDTTEVAKYSRTAAGVFSPFKFEAATPTNGGDVIGGDLHLVAYKCKVSGYSLGLAEEDYQEFSGTARGYYRLSDDLLWDLIANETAVAIS